MNEILTRYAEKRAELERRYRVLQRRYRVLQRRTILYGALSIALAAFVSVAFVLWFSLAPVGGLIVGTIVGQVFVWTTILIVRWRNPT